MRAVVQRARDASVSVSGEVVGSFSGEGLVVLVGVKRGDTLAQVEAMARKLAELRILEGERSAIDAQVPLLVVSQFTLYGDTKKGRRPSWAAAAPGDEAKPLVDDLVALLRGRGLVVSTGVFGAMMEVSLTNTGPFTVVVET